VPINSHRPSRWKRDIAESVDFFNEWFMEFAPDAYRRTRVETVGTVMEAIRHTSDMRTISPDVLREHPGILPTLRMSTSPPLARDRLVGLAYASKSLVESMESGRLPPRMQSRELNRHLASICVIVSRLLDDDILPWLKGQKTPTQNERQRASTVISDRLCGAVADPIIRNAQERRQLASIESYLEARGYRQQAPPRGAVLRDMAPGTFTFRLNIPVGTGRTVNIPMDVVVQPTKLSRNRIPILIEAKSAGDYTNTNKRRKEEATKIRQLRDTHGKDVNLVLFLCGYFDSGYLGYEAAEGIDWVWEHRIDDLRKAGL